MICRGRRPAGVLHRLLRRAAAVLPRRLIGDLAVNGTVNDLAMIGRAGRWCSPPPSSSRRATALADIGRVAEAHRPGGAGRRGPAGHRRHQGGRRRPRRRDLRQHRRHRAGRPTAVDIAADRGPAPATSSSSAATIGVHGVAVMSCPRGPRVRHRPSRATARRCNGLVAAMLAAGARRARAARPDPGRRSRRRSTRSRRPPASGSSWSSATCRSRSRSRDACGLLGLDPLYVANEGKLVAFVAPRATPTRCSRRCAATSTARARSSIGSCVAEHPGMVVARTGLGGTRVVDLPLGEQLPRIC